MPYTLSDIINVLRTEGFKTEAEELRILRDMLTQEQITEWQSRCIREIGQKYGR